MNAAHDFLEIERHKLIVQRSKPLIDLLQGEDLKTVKAIMKASKATLDKYNTENRTVIDITKTEDGLWRGNVKKVVVGKFTKYFRRSTRVVRLKIGGDCCDHLDTYCFECQKKEDEFFSKSRTDDAKRDVFLNACDSTKFPEDLKLKYILLCRSTKWPNLNPLQLALKEAIHTEILTVFQNQNQQLIATT